jgi:hypothetical protein
MGGFKWRNLSKCAYLAPDRVSFSVGSLISLLKPNPLTDGDGKACVSTRVVSDPVSRFFLRFEREPEFRAGIGID